MVYDFSELKIVSRDHGTYGTSVGASIVGNRYKRIANWKEEKSQVIVATYAYCSRMNQNLIPRPDAMWAE
ncbi:hypothetical protein CUMW_263340, partial [Citrus unshiu]